MSEVRTRRLLADYEAIRRLVRMHENRILVAGVSGNPPDRYQIVYRVRSLREEGVEIVPKDEHYVEIVLPAMYPRDAPFFRMLTPVFHPNIAPHTVCVGDHWTAGQSLAELLLRVGEMLAFQSYNTKSPLNGRAAQWVEENVARLPMDKRPFVLEDALTS
jgi:ubiquitin-protein ligase